MGIERRIHSRTNTRVAARAVAAAAAVDGIIENIGEGGVFFATDDLEAAIDEGAEVTLEFAASRGGAPVALSLRGTILRAERYFDGRAVVRAFAIRFAESLDVTAFTFA